MSTCTRIFHHIVFALLIDPHPAVALTSLVKEMKVATRAWIITDRLFPEFDGWHNGYGAFTATVRDRDALIEYIKGHEAHQRRETSKDEMRRLSL